MSHTHKVPVSVFTYDFYSSCRGKYLTTPLHLPREPGPKHLHIETHTTLILIAVHLLGFLLKLGHYIDLLFIWNYELDRLCCIWTILVFRNKDGIAKHLLGNEMLGLIVSRNEYQSIFRMQWISWLRLWILDMPFRSQSWHQWHTNSPAPNKISPCSDLSQYAFLPHPLDRLYPMIYNVILKVTCVIHLN